MGILEDGLAGLEWSASSEWHAALTPQESRAVLNEIDRLRKNQKPVRAVRARKQTANPTKEK